MKRKLALILAGLIVIGTVFASCGGDDIDNSGDKEIREEKKNKDADEEKAKEADKEDDKEDVDDNMIKKLCMGTGGTSGTYYGYGMLISQILSDEIGVKIDAQSTAGSKSNLQLITNGEIDIAIVQGDMMTYAATGTAIFEGEETDNFAAVATLYPEICQIIASENSGIETVEDLKGKRVSVGDAGSSTEFNAKQIFEVDGMDIDEDIIKNNLSFADSANALGDGKIDAFFCVACIPTTAVTELAMYTDINIVEIDMRHYKKLAKEYGFFVYETIPEDTYPGVEKTNTVAVKATLIASTDIPEDEVYCFTKALFEKKDDIANAHKMGQELDLDTTLDGIPESVPLHPGAEKFYREIGLID